MLNRYSQVFLFPFLDVDVDISNVDFLLLFDYYDIYLIKIQIN